MTPVVELLKVRMQGQYGAADDKRLSRVAADLYKRWGFRRGIMRGFWVHAYLACFYVNLSIYCFHESSGHRGT
jgi:hypothetical protein